VAWQGGWLCLESHGSSSGVTGQGSGESASCSLSLLLNSAPVVVGATSLLPCWLELGLFSYSVSPVRSCPHLQTNNEGSILSMLHVSASPPALSLSISERHVLSVNSSKQSQVFSHPKLSNFSPFCKTTLTLWLHTSTGPGHARGYLPF
jgi:hypothetical protein